MTAYTVTDKQNKRKLTTSKQPDAISKAVECSGNIKVDTVPDAAIPYRLEDRAMITLLAFLAKQIRAKGFKKLMKELGNLPLDIDKIETMQPLRIERNGVKECIECGEVFVPISSRQKYCCPTCCHRHYNREYMRGRAEEKKKMIRVTKTVVEFDGDAPQTTVKTEVI